MNIVEYKGFQGQVEWEDDALYITVLHVPDTLISQCDKATEVEQAFEELIDDYLALCEEAQIEASKPFSGTFNVRISPELHREAAMAAKREGLPSLNRWIECAIKNELHPTNGDSYSVMEMPADKPVIVMRSASHAIAVGQAERSWENWQQDILPGKRSVLRDFVPPIRQSKTNH